MKRLLIVSFMLLLAGVVFAGPPAIPPKSLIDVSDNCDQPQYYVLGRVCQSSVDGRLYKGDGNQIIELAAGTSEGDMLGAFYASEGRIRPLRGGTGLDTSGASGFPRITSGTWSVLNNAGVKAALGFLTSSDFPVTGVAAPTPGMIPKWGESGNTLVDGYTVSDFQAALTNPVTGAATTTQGMIPVWGATSNTLADGYAATYFQTTLTNPVTGVASPTPGYLTKWGESGNSIADGLKLGTLTDGRWCTYTTADGLKCTETKPAGEGGGISLSDIYSGEITDGALPKYNSATDTLSEGLKLGTLTNDKWCKYTTAGGLICNSDEPSGGGIAVSDIYLETITDGNLTSYDETSGKLKDAGPAIAYTQPDTNLPLCRTGDGAVGACTYLTDAVAGGFDVTANYAPTGTWNWSGVNAATTWPTFNQNTTGSAATATTATTATNLSSYAVLYDGAMTDGHIVKYDDTSKKLKDAGAAVGYTEPGTNLPLCRTGSGAVGACTNLTDVVVPQGGGGYTNLTSFVSQTPWRLFYSNTSGAVTELALGADGQYLKSNGASAAPTWDTPSGGGNGIDYTPPEDPMPLCSDATGAIVACTNLKDEDLASIEGSADGIGVKVETISTDPEEVIECEGKDRNYIVGFDDASFFQLPADPTGIRYCFGNNDYGKIISIVPDGSDTITHEGTATTEGEGLVSTGAKEDWICLLGLNSSKWRTISYLGSWSLASVTLPEPPNGGETPSGDIFAEGFEAQGYDLEDWTVTAGTVDPDYSLAGLNAPEGSGSYGLRANATDTAVHAGYDALNGVAAHTGQFSLYVNSEGLNTYAGVGIMYAGAHATMPGLNYVGRIYIHKASGGLRLYAGGSDDSEMIPIDTGTWYVVDYCMNGADTDACETGTNQEGWVSVDGGSTKYTFSCHAESQRYFYYGVGMNDRTADVVFGYASASSIGEN